MEEARKHVINLATRLDAEPLTEEDWHKIRKNSKVRSKLLVHLDKACRTKQEEIIIVQDYIPIEIVCWKTRN